jgi:tRNA-dihydrouridine synthase
LIGRLKENPRVQIPIFGNGDMDSPEKVLEYKNRYGVDGVMIGRASIGYPWIFNEVKHYIQTGMHLAQPDVAERVRITKKHLDFSIRWKGDRVGVLEMRRHYTNYFKGLPNFKPFRTRLVDTMEIAELYAILDEISESFSEVTA